MSAPKTDLEKQKKHHRGPLLGIRAAILWALVLLALLIVFLTVRGNEPGDGEANPVTSGAEQDTILDDEPAPVEE